MADLLTNCQFFFTKTRYTSGVFESFNFYPTFTHYIFVLKILHTSHMSLQIASSDKNSKLDYKILEFDLISILSLFI